MASTLSVPAAKEIFRAVGKSLSNDCGGSLEPSELASEYEWIEICH